MAQAKKTDPKQDQKSPASIYHQASTMVALDKIDCSDSTQLRCKLVQEIVDAYTDTIRSGVKLPPVNLFATDDKYFIGDGYHRIWAARDAGKSVIEAIIAPGGYSAALLYAAGANDTHGLRRTQADKRKAIQVLLKDPQFCKKSDNQIAKIVHVTHNTVGDVRRELEQSCQIDKIEIREFERNGKKHVMDTASKKENLARNVAAEQTEKKKFYVFDYDERPGSISNPAQLRHALHPDGFLLIISNPGNIQKVFSKLNGHLKYLWMIAVPSDEEIIKEGMHIENNWKSISVWAHKIPSRLAFSDTIALSPMDHPLNHRGYQEQIKKIFERREETDTKGEAIECIEIKDTGIKLITSGEI